MGQWVYKATPARVGYSETENLAVNYNFLCRSAYTRKGARPARVREVMPGDIIHFYYRLGTGQARTIGSFAVVDGAQRQLRLLDGGRLCRRLARRHDERRHGEASVATGEPGDHRSALLDSHRLASLPFAPEMVCAVIRHAIAALARRHLTGTGFDASYNPTFPDPPGGATIWASPWKFGLNEGPIVRGIQNHLSGLLWRLCRRSEPIVTGLRRAGFRGGWLEH